MNRTKHLGFRLDNEKASIILFTQRKDITTKKDLEIINEIEDELKNENIIFDSTFFNGVYEIEFNSVSMVFFNKILSFHTSKGCIVFIYKNNTFKLMPKVRE